MKDTKKRALSLLLSTTMTLSLQVPAMAAAVTESPAAEAAQAEAGNVFLFACESAQVKVELCTENEKIRRCRLFAKFDRKKRN